MKYEYQIQTSFGLITRTSARKYAFIVVAGKRTEACLTKFVNAMVSCAKRDLAFFLSTGEADRASKQEAIIAGAPQLLSDMLQSRRPAGCIGFSSRRDLADRMAQSAGAEHEDVQVIEILPEHVREIKPRKSL